MRIGLIYIIKNTCNDKVYIGQTIQSVEERFKQHLKPSVMKTRGSYKIYNAIYKYGKENFFVETLENNIPLEKLNELEMQYIEKYNSFKNGYNSTNGGDSKTICKIKDVELLTEMYKNKKTIKEIAFYFNVSNITIRRTLQSLGLKKINKVSKEYLLKNKDKKNNKQMAKELDVSTATITRAFSKFNISRGKGSVNYMNIQNKSKIKKQDLLKVLHLSNEKIAEILGITKSYVSKLLKKHNLSKRIK